MDISFKELNSSLIKQSDYINWINDESINNFLEVRFQKQNEDDLITYIEHINKSERNFLFGIFKNDKHIGNVKLYNIDSIHKFADISIVVGDRDLQNKGIGARAISFINSFAKDKCGLRKVMASAYSNNKPSIGLFYKCGFQKVGEFKNHYFYKDKLVDKIYLEFFL